MEVDEDEVAGGAVLGVGVEEDGASEFDLGDADVVHAEGIDGFFLEGLDVGAVEDAGDAGADGLRAVLEQVGAMGFEASGVEPD